LSESQNFESSSEEPSKEMVNPVKMNALHSDIESESADFDKSSVNLK